MTHRVKPRRHVKPWHGTNHRHLRLYVAALLQMAMQRLGR